MTTRRRNIIFVAVATAAIALVAAPFGGAVPQATVRVKGPSYSKVFKVVSCINKGETDINLTGKAPGLKLRLVGKYKTGTLRITGLIILNGKVTSIVVGDAGDIKVKGVITTSSNRGPFTVTGRCA